MTCTNNVWCTEYLFRKFDHFAPFIEQLLCNIPPHSRCFVVVVDDNIAIFYILGLKFSRICGFYLWCFSLSNFLPFFVFQSPFQCIRILRGQLSAVFDVTKNCWPIRTLQLNCKHFDGVNFVVLVDHRSCHHGSIYLWRARRHLQLLCIVGASTLLDTAHFAMDLPNNKGRQR